MDDQFVAKQDVVNGVLDNIKTGLVHVNNCSLDFTIDESTNDLAVFVDLNHLMKDTFSTLASDFGQNLCNALITIASSVEEYKLLDDHLGKVVDASSNSSGTGNSNRGTI